MNRRSFLSMSPAFPVAAVSASVVLREEGKPPVELDVSVLRLQEGDRLIVTVPGMLSIASAERIKAALHQAIPMAQAVILSDGMKIEGVLRGSD